MLQIGRSHTPRLARTCSPAQVVLDLPRQQFEAVGSASSSICWDPHGAPARRTVLAARIDVRVRVRVRVCFTCMLHTHMLASVHA
jgi:hypothetical protein